MGSNKIKTRNMSLIFEQYIKGVEGGSISTSLLWEYDMDRFDWNKGRAIVVERIIERGTLQDFKTAIELYGGIENFRTIIRDEVAHLSPMDMHFVCTFFDLKKEKLLCYRRKLAREAHLNS